jgi:hypothetical protein
VVDGRFIPGKMRLLNIISNATRENDILNYVVIVRTKFSDFRNRRKCETDITGMCDENEIIAKIVKLCVNNPE